MSLDPKLPPLPVLPDASHGHSHVQPVKRRRLLLSLQSHGQWHVDPELEGPEEPDGLLPWLPLFDGTCGAS